MTDHMKIYLTYKDKIGDRSTLYKRVVEHFNIKVALYPGSHVDITPSLFIPDVTYIDNFKGAISFFKQMETIKNYINDNKSFKETSTTTFYSNNYEDDLNIKKVDLIISQYAGFVGQATKKYLKESGILLCNDSHGDATLAYFDDDYEFVGVLGSSNQIIETKLDKYFKLSKSKEVDLPMVYKNMKGPKYTNQASNYLFRLKPNHK